MNTFVKLNKIYQALMLPFFVLLLIPLGGRAQNVYKAVHGEWEATAFAGGSFLGDNVYSTPVQSTNQTSSRAVGLKYSAGSLFGIRVADNQWKHWGASFEYGFSNQPLTFTNLSDAIPSLHLGHSIHRFAYDVLFYPRDRDYKLRPFVFAGPGVSLFHVSGSSKDAAAAQGLQLSSPWKFNVNWGGGMKYLLVKQVAASVQFSDSISGVPGYGLPDTGRVASGIYVPGFRPNGLMHNWMIDAGLVIQWDDK